MHILKITLFIFCFLFILPEKSSALTLKSLKKYPIGINLLLHKPKSREFKKIYGSGFTQGFELFLVKPLRKKIEHNFSIGYIPFSGHSFTTRHKFHLIPFNTGLFYKLYEKYGISSYAGTALAFWPYLDKIKNETNETEIGIIGGFNITGRAKFNLNYFDPVHGKKFQNDTGIKKLYIILDIKYSLLLLGTSDTTFSAFGLSNSSQINTTGLGLSVGLMFEF